MDKNIFWIWLQCCLGVDNPRIHRIFEVFEDAYHIYNADEHELKISGVFIDKELLKLNDKNLDTAKKIYNNCFMRGYHIFSLQDENYPERLKKTPTPPVVIYVKGKIPDKNRLFAAIVGTRHSSITGKKAAFSLAYDLAKSGAVVVSGGAMGIDTQSHLGAIQAGGETVCVLGCGINYNYLPTLENMRNEISKHGALISEYPPDYPPTKFTFPKRNRIISGISDCTVVVEAGKTSGALITAKEAVKQNRTVFAVPGSIESQSTAGSNLLIQEGAKTLLSAENIIDWYNSKKQKNNDKNISDTQITPDSISKIRTKSEKKKILPNVEKIPKELTLSHKQTVKATTNEKKENKIPDGLLTENALSVYHTISDTPIHVNDIKLATGLKINDILSALTELEMNDLISVHSGRRYTKK
ncbi:MAG: DNA-processing protein DprA [Acutalibacteraceae bacterium]